MAGLQRFERRGRFHATPEALWPLVADTPTLNRAIGLPAISYDFTPLESGGSRTVATVRLGRWTVLRWVEHPFLWREPYGYLAFREFEAGPFARMTASTELTREGDETDVLVAAEIEPRNALGRLLLACGVGQQSVDKVFGQIRQFERYLRGEIADPFPTLAPRKPIPERARLLADRLVEAGCHAEIVDRLHAHIANARDEEVARMRPFELADRWAVDRRATLAAFLEATVAGLLTLSWDVLCPGCRVGKREVTTLRDLRAEAHCDACNITFDASFDQLVEVRFSPSPAIRSVELAEFCIGGPMNTPHIVAQTPVAPGERCTLRFLARPGLYAVRAAGAAGQTALEVLPFGRDDAVGPAVDGRAAGVGGGAAATVPPMPRRPTSGTSAVPLTIQPDGIRPGHAMAAAGEIALEVTSVLEAPTALIVEDGRWPDTIATAALVSTLPEFRDLFSSEVLAPGLQLGISRLAFLFTDLTGSTALYQRVGQARAFRIVQDQFGILGAVIAANRGTIVKTIGDAVMATFTTGADALAAGLAIQREIRQLDVRGAADPATLVRVGIHQGPCVAVTANERLDYFGTTVNIAARVEHEARGGEVAATADVCESPEAQALLAEACVRAETTVARLKGIAEPVRLYRLTPLPEH